MPPFENVTVSFAISYNWPQGHASFHALQLETRLNHDLGILYRVFAKRASEDQFHAFDEALQPLSHRELNDIFRQKAAQGSYLIGDEFLVEVCDPAGNVIFGTKVDARRENWPVEATDESHVIKQYYTSPRRTDGIQQSSQR